MRDLAPVGGVDLNPLILEVNPSLPVKSVPELIAYAKAHPGEINMASGGVGSTPHLAGELFKMLTGVNMLHVPYRGDAPAVTDLLGGQVQVMFDQIILVARIISAPAGCARWPSPAQTACRCCRICRRWPISCRATKPLPGKASRPEGHAARHRRQAQHRDQSPRSPIPRSQRIADLGGIPMPMTPPDSAS